MIVSSNKKRTLVIFFFDLPPNTELHWSIAFLPVRPTLLDVDRPDRSVSKSGNVTLFRFRAGNRVFSTALLVLVLVACLPPADYASMIGNKLTWKVERNDDCHDVSRKITPSVSKRAFLDTFRRSGDSVEECFGSIQRFRRSLRKTFVCWKEDESWGSRSNG